MPRGLRSGLAIAAAVAALGLASPAAAVSFTQMVVFGDSLSDSGNLCPIPVNCPSPPYAAGRFSNGPVWVEQLASSLGLPLAPSSLGGTNYATGGATTDAIFNQANAYLTGAGGVADPDALYVLNGGGNDIILGFDPVDSAASLALAALLLSNAGAQHILVSNLGDIGATPQELAGQRAPTIEFNDALVTDLAGFGLSVALFDAFGLLDDMIANPGSYGLADVTSACWDGITLCATPSDHLWWDRIHPTTVGHGVLAAGALLAIPEPSVPVLLAGGLGLLAVSRLGRGRITDDRHVSGNGLRRKGPGRTESADAVPSATSRW